MNKIFAIIISKIISTIVLTLKSHYPAFPEWHGQIKRDIMLMVAHHLQELKLKLVQCLMRKQWSYMSINSVLWIGFYIYFFKINITTNKQRHIKNLGLRFVSHTKLKV